MLTGPLVDCDWVSKMIGSLDFFFAFPLNLLSHKRIDTGGRSCSDTSPCYVSEYYLYGGFESEFK